MPKQLTKAEAQKRSRVLNSIETAAIVVFSSFLMSVSTMIFLNPVKLYAGGVTGIAQIILHALGLISKGKEGFNAFEGYLGLVNFILIFPFNILAWFKLSKKYAIYTTASTILQSIFLSLHEVFGKVQVFYDATSGTYDVLSCAIVAGLLGGIANGLLMRRGATSGGIIVLCQYLNLKRGKSVGFINLLVSGSIMVVGALLTFFSGAEGAFGAALGTALYTFINFLIGSLTLDWIHTAYNKVKLEVITEKGQAIVDELMKELPHGITIEKGIGAYSKHEKDILNVIIQKPEPAYYIKAVREIDPEAFVVVVPITNIFGKFIQKVIDM